MVATTELALYGLSPLVILLNISLLTVLETKSLTSKDVIISSKGNHEYETENHHHTPDRFDTAKHLLDFLPNQIADTAKKKGPKHAVFPALKNNQNSYLVPILKDRKYLRIFPNRRKRSMNNENHAIKGKTSDKNVLHKHKSYDNKTAKKLGKISMNNSSTSTKYIKQSFRNKTTTISQESLHLAQRFQVKTQEGVLTSTLRDVAMTTSKMSMTTNSSYRYAHWLQRYIDADYYDYILQQRTRERVWSFVCISGILFLLGFFLFYTRMWANRTFNGPPDPHDYEVGLPLSELLKSKAKYLPKLPKMPRFSINKKKYTRLKKTKKSKSNSKETVYQPY